MLLRRMMFLLSTFLTIAQATDYVERYGTAKVIPVREVFQPQSNPNVGDMPKVTGNITVIVASKNTVKLEAVAELFTYNPRTRQATVKIIGIDAPSGVANQPLGLNYGRKGADNRIQAVKQSPIVQGIAPEGLYFCAIENFFTSSRDIMPRDHAYILIETPDGSQFRAISDGIEIAQEIYDRALAKGEISESGCSKTIGEVLEEEFGYPRGDWFSKVTQDPYMTRKEQILSTLQNGGWF